VAFGTNVLTPSHPTPALANLTVAEARTSLAKVHMDLAEAKPIKSITVGSGDIVSQKPKPGVSVKEGTTVTVVVSDGLPNVTVPNLSGMTCPQASNALTAAHFKSVCAPGAYNNNVNAGVLDIWTLGSAQNPTKAPYGSTITLVPSLGHEPATVPQIPQTYTFAQAQAALQAVGLSATQNNQSSTSVPAGDVISTAPASGAQAPYNSSVTVTVSTGPPTTTVPNVKGDSIQQATTAMQNAGLSVSGVSGNPSKNVVGTQPSIGSTVQTGSAVQLFTY
jgi:serine/threonine-protein kinase